ncbi:uncharacterized protein [Antedon mediterranea]|uniref:uncharacterized protein isoform X2 n=1 Tax=Antedon mediterranea TaxID=105859 RepID=UPI003AF7E8D3
MLFDLEKCRGVIDEDNFDEIIEELKESGLKAPASKTSTRGKAILTSVESDEEENSAPASKTSTRAKATLTSVESDEEENSEYSDDSNEVYTPKMKGKRALTSKGTRKRKMADNSEESDEGENACYYTNNECL